MIAGEWRDGWFVVPHHVLFSDIDAFGHVNNAVFLTYFEHARTAMWFHLTGGRVAHDVTFIVARAEVDFRAQIAFEEIEIRVRIGEIRTTSFDTVYEIRKHSDGSLASNGKVIVVLFDWQTRTKKPIDAELRQKMRQFQHIAEV
jgi:acyl-CoA thioester hydrolase